MQNHPSLARPTPPSFPSPPSHSITVCHTPKPVKRNLMSTVLPPLCNQRPASLSTSAIPHPQDPHPVLDDHSLVSILPPPLSPPRFLATIALTYAHNTRRYSPHLPPPPAPPPLPHNPMPRLRASASPVLRHPQHLPRTQTQLADLDRACRHRAINGIVTRPPGGGGGGAGKGIRGREEERIRVRRGSRCRSERG